MCPLFQLENRIARKIVPLFLTLILISCGTATSLSSKSLLTSAPPSSPVAQAVKVESARVAGVFIRSTGFQCPLRTPYTGFDTEYTPQRLVLAEDRLVYNQSEIQQMRAYLKDGRRGLMDFFVLDAQETAKKLPPTLHLVQGGSQCTVHLQITNNSSGGIQINLVGVQVIGKPQPNNYQYRAIDICSITDDCTEASGPGPCSLFGATVNLSPDMATSAMAKPINLQPDAWRSCSKLYQRPKDVVDFILSLASTKPYVYSVVPTLSITSSQGTSLVTLSTMASKIAFITSKQISCYALQGTQFVQVPLNAYHIDANCNFPDGA